MSSTSPVSFPPSSLKADIPFAAPVSGASPFVKWAGGKRKLLGEICRRLPPSFRAYHEPFTGGGALFFTLAAGLKQAFLSDANNDLIIAYQVVQQSPHALLAALARHAKHHSKDYYYAIRGRHGLEDPVEVAARLIYLNKTCFNGLYRVNSRGEFNVPAGAYENPVIVNKDGILACHKALQGVSVTRCGFEAIAPRRGDFVYFDPPYHPTTETSFTKYASDDFAEKDQIRLCEFYTELGGKGVLAMLSNSDTPFIRQLYGAFFIATVKASRPVNCKADKRGAVREVLITNYEPLLP